MWLQFDLSGAGAHGKVRLAGYSISHATAYDALIE